MKGGLYIFSIYLTVTNILLHLYSSPLVTRTPRNSKPLFTLPKYVGNLQRFGFRAKSYPRYDATPCLYFGLPRERFWIRDCKKKKNPKIFSSLVGGRNMAPYGG